MHEEIVIAGFGGQGVLFAGELLAYAGLTEGREVTWIPSYGPEMRGGTAHCMVIIADAEIGAPLVSHPTAAVVLSTPALERYGPLVQPGGVLIVDGALVTERTGRADIREIVLPAKDIATALGWPQIANVILIGALIAATGVVKLETAEQVLEAQLGGHADVGLANKAALHRGAALIAAANVSNAAA